jgi:hypothetical protein
VRYGFSIVLIAVIGCSRQPTGGRPDGGQHVPISPGSEATASADPEPQPLGSVVRDVPFDGGVARVETGRRGAERVILLRPDGMLVGESWCAPPLAGYDAVRTFYAEVREAIVDGNVERVADLMAFPMRVNGRSTRSVTSREQFLRERERILTPSVVEGVRAGDPGKVFCNAHGVMFGEGVLWANVQANGRLAVDVVNAGQEPNKGK